MRVIYRLIVLCVALGAALPSQAEQLRGLYQVREPVSGQQAEERAAALQRAFDTLLLRLTGDAQEIDCRYPGIKGLVLRAEFVRKR